MVADTFNLKVVDGVLFECDCRKYMKSTNEDFQLEGANPSAEGGDEDEGGEGEKVMVHDIEDQFRLVWLKTEEGLKPSKDAFKSHLKSMFPLNHTTHTHTQTNNTQPRIQSETTG